MTEYDYSPEGYERYLATHNRVSNWVQDQNTRLQQYSNPFVRPASIPPSEPPESRRSSSRHNDRSYNHQPATRSTQSSHTHRSTHPQQTYHRNPSPVYYVSPTVVSSPTLDSKGYNSSYRTYDYDPNAREIVLPPPRMAETYVIIPPSGRRVEVVVCNVYVPSQYNVANKRRLQTDPHAYSHTSSRSGRHHYIGAMKKDRPFFKRLFTGFGHNSPPSSSSKLSRSSSSSRRDRDRYRSH